VIKPRLKSMSLDTSDSPRAHEPVAALTHREPPPPRVASAAAPTRMAPLWRAPHALLSRLLALSLFYKVLIGNSAIVLIGPRRV
jgi:hypothetical protein